MNDSVYQKLKETSWQRPLTAQEERELDAFLATDAQARTEWNEEASLNQLLGKLPPAPVSSNFAAQVLQSIKLEEAKISRVQKRGWTAWRAGFGWVFRPAIAVFALCFGLFGIYEYRLSERVEMAHNLENVSAATTTSKVGWLEDFETINKMSRVTLPADEELLAALQ